MRWAWLIALTFIQDATLADDLSTNANDFRIETFHFGRRLSSHTRNPLSQDRTCIAGHLCSLASLVSGSNDNILMTRNTCGDENPDALDGDGSVVLPPTGFLLTVAGGEYRLCWCVGACNNFTDYSIEIGNLILQGPSPLSQDRTCVAGHVCSLNVLGVASENERLLVQETCGDGKTPLGWPNFGQSLPNSPLQAGEGTFSWGDVVVSSAGGVYRLCWCGAGDARSELQW